jgi:hypothetical protein
VCRSRWWPLDCCGWWRAAVLCLVVALGSACTDQRRTAQVDVDTQVSVCVTGSEDCYALGVPEASVEIADGSGRVLATGKTDDVGRSTISVPDSLPSGKVTVRSPLFEGGLVEAPLGSVSEGGASSVTVRGRLASGAS